MRGLSLSQTLSATGAQGIVAFADENNDERILAHLADGYGVRPVPIALHPAPLHPARGEAPRKQGPERSSSRPMTVLLPERARERRRVVKADLGTFEPPAARLRRSDGDTGPQSALFPFAGGVRLHSGSPVPQRKKRDSNPERSKR